ncbi:MAG: hypothetical protein LAP86_06535 [Acidobacteriia bacterium]|nr:hypothetical protein [Terriglobia bacterium]
MTIEQEDKLKAALAYARKAKRDRKKVKVIELTWGEYKRMMKGTPNNYKMMITEHLPDEDFRRLIQTFRKACA